MSTHHWLTSLGTALTLSVAGAVFAADQGAPADLSAEIAQLRAEVAQLRSQQNQNWLNERRAEEVKALIREVLADADTRASMLDKGVTAGHDGKTFFLASDDGKFRLNLSANVQARYIFNTRDTKGANDPINNNSDDTETGFQLRRLQLYFEGYVGDPRFDYRVILAADRNTTEVDLEEGEVGYKFADNFAVGAGRFKDAFLREDTVSSRRLQVMERAVVTQAFGTAYVEGVRFDWKPINDFRLRSSFNDGANSGSSGTSGNGNALNDFNNDRTDYALTGRVDWKVMGDWSQADDFNAWSEGPTSVILGAGIHYEKGESGEHPHDLSSSNATLKPLPYDQYITATVDAGVKYHGFSFFGAGFYQQIDTADSVSTVDNLGNVTTVDNNQGNLNNWGAMAQVAYFVIPDKLEPYARYEFIDADKAITGRSSQVHIVTLGANYYFRKHAAKFTTDVVWAINPLTNANTLGGISSGQGLIADTASDRDNQLALRAQFQLLF